jgi:TonB family protein
MRVSKAICVAIISCALAVNALGQEARKALSKPTPRYPEIAKQMNLVGTVKVEVVIGQDGKVKESKVIGGHPLLVGSVLEKLKEWKYESGKTEITATLTFDFHP